MAQITLPGFTPRKNGYQWCGVYTCAVDLAVDEQGLWALWGDADNSFRLYAQMIDVYQNVVTHTWALATGKRNLNLLKKENIRKNICRSLRQRKQNKKSNGEG